MSFNDCLRRVPNIHIVTFSGAHGTGKSTTISDLKADVEKLSSDVGPDVELVPSCSKEWCRRNGIVAYDDINKLGRRFEMQQSLPGLLEDLLIEKVNACRRDTIILCDRWLGDIAAYSKIELSELEFIKVEETADAAYRSIMAGLNEFAFGGTGASLCLTHVFIPLSACQHSLPRGEVEGKVRATGDQQVWEDAYNANRFQYTHPDRTLVISSPDRQGRLAEICQRFLDVRRQRDDA